jgi:recombination protein RecT
MHNSPEKTISLFMQNAEKQIKSLLPATFDKGRYVALIEQYLSDNQALMACDQHTLRKAVLDAAAMGLEIGSPLNHATLMRFNSRTGKATVGLIIEYRGYIALCFRSGKVRALAARAVFENDAFSFGYGSEKFLRHTPAAGSRGHLVAAYAIAYMAGNQFDFEVIDQEAAAQARRDSPGASEPGSIWNKRPANMWVKTAIRRLSSRLPQCGEDNTAFWPGSKQTEGNQKLQDSDEFKAYQNAMDTQPTLHAEALSILNLATPETATECRLITNLMRYLFKQHQVQQAKVN